jgi:hypothetical protein
MQLLLNIEYNADLVRLTQGGKKFVLYLIDIQHANYGETIAMLP